MRSSFSPPRTTANIRGSNRGNNNSQSDVVGTDLSSSSAARILVVGDSGVGKSMLIQHFNSMAVSRILSDYQSGNRGRGGFLGGQINHQNVSQTQLNIKLPAPPPPTVGASVNATPYDISTTRVPSPLKQEQHPSTSWGLIDWIDVGGNRGFCVKTREPFYENIDGVIFVYRHNDAASEQSLYYWYQELVTCKVISGTTPFILVATTAKAIAHMPHNTSNTNKMHSMGPMDLSNPHRQGSRGQLDAVQAMIRPIRHALSQLTLLALSLVLFGPGQTAVPFRGVPSDIPAFFDKMAEQFPDTHRYHGCINSPPIDVRDTASFYHTSGDISAFLTSIISRHS